MKTTPRRPTHTDGTAALTGLLLVALVAAVGCNGAVVVPDYEPVVPMRERMVVGVEIPEWVDVLPSRLGETIYGVGTVQYRPAHAGFAADAPAREMALMQADYEARLAIALVIGSALPELIGDPRLIRPLQNVLNIACLLDARTIRRYSPPATDRTGSQWVFVLAEIDFATLRDTLYIAAQEYYGAFGEAPAMPLTLAEMDRRLRAVHGRLYPPTPLPEPIRSEWYVPAPRPTLN